MGRQSARIYYQGLDHKEMVTWDGTKYQYHDKAYIWNSQTSSFELVWEKYHGLKLLYDTGLAIEPVASENNKYIYFTENGDGSIIYRIVVNAKNPEAEEYWTSSKYSKFTAPISSRGFAVYAEQKQYGTDYDYEILNLEDGTVSATGNFNAYDYLWAPNSMFPPTYTNQEVTPAESGENHNYASILSSYGAAATYQPWNFILFIAPTGISALLLSNREGAGNYIIGARQFDIGRLNDGTGRGLLPRFFLIEWDDTVSIYEAISGSGGAVGDYQAVGYGRVVNETLPFQLAHGAGGGLQGEQIKVVRDGKLPIVASDNRLWFIEVQRDGFNYIDTGIDIPFISTWDISPDYKYLILSESTSWATVDCRIVSLESKKTIINVGEESGLSIYAGNGVKFVGHNCILVTGYLPNSWIRRYRLYKWR